VKLAVGKQPVRLLYPSPRYSLGILWIEYVSGWKPNIIYYR